MITIKYAERFLVTLMEVTAMGLSLAQAKEDQFVNMLTRPHIGASIIQTDVGLSNDLCRHRPKGVRTQVQSTKASVENLNLLQQGKGELALALGDSVKLAWDGDAEAGFPSRQLDKLRAFPPFLSNYIHRLSPTKRIRHHSISPG